MNGLHDMGGLHGFGRVEVEAGEPVFHEPWEARVFGIVQCLGRSNIDAGRRSIERLDPVTYLRNGYYGRWLAALERALRDTGIVEDEELRARMRRRRRTGRAVRRTTPRPSSWQPSPGGNYARDLDRPPLLRDGQAVRRATTSPTDTPACPRTPAAGAARSSTDMRRWYIPTTTRTGAARIRSTSTPFVSTATSSGATPPSPTPS